MNNCKIKPHVNQICIYASHTPFDLIEYCHSLDILVEAYSPIGTGRLLKNEAVKLIADKYSVSIAQLGIRYCLQLNTLPLPKSVSKGHIEENKDIDAYSHVEIINHVIHIFRNDGMAFSVNVDGNIILKSKEVIDGSGCLVG